MPDAQPGHGARDAEPAGGREDGAAQPHVASTATLLRALPGIVLVGLASLLPLWGVLSLEWGMLAVTFSYVADGAADGLFTWLRARRAEGGAPGDATDRVLVREFVRTYFVVVAAMAMVVYMVFSGRLLKPGGTAPSGVYEPFETYRLWAVVAVFFAVRAFTYWWDFARGREAVFLAPAGVVAEPLRRLFVLQFGVLVGGLIVFWPFRSSKAALVTFIVLVAVAEVGLAILERLRTARIRAAAEAGVAAPRAPRDAARARPRGGRRRSRRH